jgi:FAD/FMN-containing dehydrogenase
MPLLHLRSFCRYHRNPMEQEYFRAPREPLVGPGGADCHVRDMTATFSADLTLRDVQAKLAQHEQWLPIDGDLSQTLGMLVSGDSTGPMRLGYGAWRDLLLGAQFQNGRGELITAGGRTVKNVAGYDLTKFMVGQRGIFGRLVTITTRTYRRPARSIRVRLAPDYRLLQPLIPTPLRPQWAMLTREALWLGYLGDDATLGFYRGAVPQCEPSETSDHSLDEDVEYRARRWVPAGEITFRASVPPARLGDFVRKLPAELWSADAAFGIVVGAVESKELMSGIRLSADRVQGRVEFSQGMYGPPIELSTNPVERRIIEQLKRAFDPDNALQPLPWRQN